MGTMSDHGLTTGSTPSDHGIDPSDFGGGSASYNFIETVPTTSYTTSEESVTITGKTMRHSGVDIQAPDVTVNGSVVSVTKIVGDENIYSFSFSTSLSIGVNVFEIKSDNGAELTKTLTVTRTAVAPSCSLSHSGYFKAGSHTITMTTDYDLIVAPTLVASIGTLSAFTGSAKTWVASLVIVDQNGNGVFSDAVLEGEGGIGSTINSGSTYLVDTVIPVIGTANFSRTLWHYENGSMNCTIDMGEDTTGFTGQIDLSNFGLSTSYSLSPSGNNMIATFTPSRVDAGPANGSNIRVSDRCGNAATPKALTDNQLQVIAYRLSIQNLTFSAYSAVSNALSGALVFDTPANSHVSWGAGQTNSGNLTYSTDYTIDDYNKIHLDETVWADTIAANALGLLNVDVYED